MLKKTPEIDPIDDRLCPSSFVRQRQGNISDKTLRQRIAKGRFPAPDVFIGNRRHWWLSTILRHESTL